MVSKKPQTPGEIFIAGLFILFCIFVILILVFAGLQGGSDLVWRAILILFVLFFGAGTIGVILKEFMSAPFVIVALVLMSLGLATLYYTGSLSNRWQLAWDVLGLFAGIFLAYSVVYISWFLQKLSGISQPIKYHRGRFMLLLVFLCWGGVSAVTYFRPSQLPIDPDRFAQISAADSFSPESSSNWNDQRIGIALSGGGYRAAIYHAGTLYALERLGLRADTISTVSGGSIIGGYYAIGGDPVAFKDAVASGRFNLKRELVLLQNVFILACPMRLPLFDVEMLFFCDHDRIHIQAAMLDRLLFRGKEHTNMNGSEAPQLVINATDLTYGLLVGLLSDGMIIQSPDNQIDVYRGSSYQPEAKFSLAEKVAISGAFPVAFPSANFGVKVESQRSTGDGTRPLRLADGGVADNTGLHTLINAYKKSCADSNCPPEHTLEKNWHSDVMLVSDGGAIFGVESELGALGQLSRAVDIGGARAGNRFTTLSDVPVVHISAQKRFLKPGKQFQVYRDRQSDDEYSRALETHVRFDPREQYPDSLIEEIVRLLSDDEDSRLHRYWNSYRNARGDGSDLDKSNWRKQISRMSRESAEECITNSGIGNQIESTLLGLCEAVLMRHEIRLGVDKLLTAFRDTSTLDDQFGDVRTEQLFVLGQLLSYLSWPEINQAFNKSANTGL